MTGGLVGVDLGGTKVLAASVDPSRSGPGAVLADDKRPTPTDAGHEGVLGAVVDAVRALDPSPAAVGVGAPGAVDPTTGRILYAPNLDGFDEPVPVADLLAERLGCPVVVLNDVNAAALGEARAGAAAGVDDVLAVWLGTGLGAGLILDGALRIGPHGLAGELGHATVVAHHGRLCGCGGHGHVEAYIGRRAMEAEARARHAAGTRTALVELAGEGTMRSKVFRKAYDAGDEVAVDLLHEGLDLLAVAVANVVVTADVSTVVVGGGLGERFAAEATGRIGRGLARFAVADAVPEVVAATLGDHAGPLGAAGVARDLLDGRAGA